MQNIYMNKYYWIIEHIVWYTQKSYKFILIFFLS